MLPYCFIPTNFLPSEEEATETKLIFLAPSPPVQFISHAHALMIKSERMLYEINFLNMKRLLFYQHSMPHIFMKCK